MNDLMKYFLWFIMGGSIGVLGFYLMEYWFPIETNRLFEFLIYISIGAKL